MENIISNTVKYLLLTSVFSCVEASDLPDNSGGNADLRQNLSAAAKKRKQSLRQYANETGMEHLQMMFADDAEIEEKYGAEAKKIAEKDKKVPSKKRKRNVITESAEEIDDTDVMVFGKSGITVEKADGTELFIDDEPLQEPVAKRPALAPRKLSMPKWKASQSIHKNPELAPNLAGTFVVYDSETTTLSPKCGGRLVELAAIKIGDGVPLETLHILFNPDMKSWDGAFKAHGLHESYLRAQAPFFKVAKYVEDFFGQDVRCAHNGFKFDDPYLNFELRRARVFWQFRQMLSPDSDFAADAPASSVIDKDTAKKGYDLLKLLGIVTDTNLHENLEAKANSLASAAMLYLFKDHMNQLEMGYKADDKKPGPMMFLNGNMLPDSEEYRDNHEAAVARLAWFRLIRQDTDTFEQRAMLKQPYVKYIRDAIQIAEVYLSAAYQIFQTNILDEVAFRANPLDTSKMFDTLVFVRGNQEQFTRAVSIDNHKLDSLIDYYGLNRHARETGTHGAAIDTSLLYQVLRKLAGAEDTNPALVALLSKTQVEIEEFLFAKNSVNSFDEKGKLVSTAVLHDDQIKGTTRDRNGRRHEVAVAPSAAPSYSGLMAPPTMHQPSAMPNQPMAYQFGGMPAPSNSMPQMMPQGYPMGYGMMPHQMSYMPQMPGYYPQGNNAYGQPMMYPQMPYMQQMPGYMPQQLGGMPPARP